MFRAVFMRTLVSYTKGTIGHTVQYVHCERVGSSVVMIEFVLMNVCMQGSTHSCPTGPGHIVF